MTETKWKTITGTGFQFFGEMTASISHEIKNVMAVINENAGLLQDLLLLGQKGTPPDPARLSRLADQIMTQIKRSDLFIKKLNRFSHSVDIPINSIDLGDMLAFSLDLGNRIAINRGVHLKLEPPPQPIIITVHVFCFLNMIWLCLDHIMKNGISGSELTITCRKVAPGAAIGFKPLKKSDERLDPRSLPERMQYLLELLNGKMDVHDEQGEMILTLPEKCSG